MSREIRPVALDWEHPRDGNRTYSDGSPRYIGLFSREDMRLHLEGDADDVDPADYMPEIPEGTPYGWQMYETVSEGSPISPIFRTKEELADWLASPAAGREQVPPTRRSTSPAKGVSTSRSTWLGCG